jgi:hypothetical protein
MSYLWNLSVAGLGNIFGRIENRNFGAFSHLQLPTPMIKRESRWVNYPEGWCRWALFEFFIVRGTSAHNFLASSANRVGDF